MKNPLIPFLFSAATLLAPLTASGQKNPDARHLSERKKNRVATTLHALYLPQARNGPSVQLQNAHRTLALGNPYIGYIPTGNTMHPVSTGDIAENLRNTYRFRNSLATHIVVDGVGATVMDSLDGEPVIRKRVYRNSQTDNQEVLDADSLYAAIVQGLDMHSRLDTPAVDLVLMSSGAKDDLPFIAKYFPAGTSGLILNAGRDRNTTSRDNMMPAQEADAFPLYNPYAFLETVVYHLPDRDSEEPLPKNGDVIAFFVYDDKGRNNVLALNLRDLARDYEANMEKMTGEANDLSFMDPSSRLTNKRDLNRRLRRGENFDDMPALTQLSAMAFMLEKLSQSDNFKVFAPQALPLFQINAADTASRTPKQAVAPRPQTPHLGQ